MAIRATILCILLIAASSQIIAIPNCNIADLVNAVCITCKPNFLLTAGQCTQCLPNYILLNGTCVSAPAPLVTATASPSSPTLNDIISNPILLAQLLAYIQQSAVSSSTSLQTNPCSQALNGVCLNCSQGYSLLSGTCVSSTTTTTTTTSNPSNPPGLTTSAQSTQQTSSSTTTTNAATTQITSAATTSTDASSSIASTAATSATTTTTTSAQIVFLPFYSPTNPSIPLVTMTSTTNSTLNTDDNCKTFNSTLNLCTQCFRGYYVSPLNRTCITTNPLCQNVTADNLCLACYIGYILSNGNCIIIPNYNTASDPNCQTSSNGVCFSCYLGYYLNQTINLCVKANPNCQNITAINTCLTCFPGYQLVNGNCIILPYIPLVQLSLNRDQYCFRSTLNGTCLVCARRYYVSSSGKCMQVDSNCQNYTTTGVCQLCYIGFKVINGGCVLSSSTNATSTGAVQCAHRTVLINGNCLPVDNQCQTWSMETALCTSCYGGYELIVGVCVRRE